MGSLAGGFDTSKALIRPREEKTNWDRKANNRDRFELLVKLFWGQNS